MKTRLLFILIIGLVSINQIFGQTNETLSNKSGLYMTAADFSSGKLSYEINCLTEKHKIKSSDFLGSKTVKIIHQDSTIKIPKSSIWGYRLCGGKEYRIYQNNEYEILDKSGFVVYLIKETIHSHSKSNKTVSKTSYFFSEELDGQLKELSMKNVETSFLNNKKFHELIDVHFKSDSDLLIYDDYYKMLRLNHVYLESLK